MDKEDDGKKKRSGERQIHYIFTHERADTSVPYY